MAAGTAYAIADILGQYSGGLYAGMGTSQGGGQDISYKVLAAAAHGVAFAAQSEFKEKADNSANGTVILAQDYSDDAQHRKRIHEQSRRVDRELSRTYDEMLSQNIVGSDQFFHCLAACRAAKASRNPNMVRDKMNMKEVLDYAMGRLGLYGNRGALSHDEMMEDIRNDQAANEHGLQSSPSENCNTRCGRFINEMTNFPKSQELMRERYPAK